MKTARQWFETLPEPYGEMAIANTDKKLLRQRPPSLASAIIRSFTWAGTDEGHDFWEGIENNIIYLESEN